MATSARDWAQEEFGHADLGDARREARLLQLAAAAARRPAGTITRTFRGSAQREAAFRFVENDAVDVAALGEASYGATARRCSSERLIVVAVDGCSLSLPDRLGARGFGPVGTYHRMVKGVHVMNSLAVTRDGCPVGLLDQQWWVRKERVKRRFKGCSHDDPRPLEDRESYNWVRALRAGARRLQEHAPGCTPWYQLDAAGAARAVLEAARDERLLITVRAGADRRLQFSDGTIGHLYPTIRRQPISGFYQVDIPERPEQQGRRARMAVRYMTAPLTIRYPTKKIRGVLRLNVVCAQEVSPPLGAEPIEWILLTTRRVASLEDALQVVSAYSLRWRVEDFHKAWKSGACDIESSQLRKLDHFLRWATIMAAVAARIERLKHLSRSEPDRPATDEFSQDEIDAVLLLRKEETRVAYELGDVPTIGELTRWIADLGGYMGSKRSPPPGTIVLRRGLEQVAPALIALRALRRAKSPRSG